jgi:hypothetical protein
LALDKPKNIEFSIDQRLRRNAFIDSGLKQIEEPMVTYSWKMPDLPDLPQIEQSPKQEFQPSVS